MDYAADGDNSGYYGLSLIKEIINHNFRYTMAKQGDAICDASGNLFVAPKGRDMMWEAKFLRKEGPSQPGGEDSNAASRLDGITGPTNWYKEDFDDSGWQTKRFPTASEGTGAPYYSQWDGTYNVLFIRREFYLDHDPGSSTYRFYTYHDDDYRVYLNGVSIDSQDGWSTDFNNYRTVSIPSSRLKAGRNVLAIMVQQNWGGAYFDCGILRVTPSKVSLKLTGTDWQTYVTPGYEMDFSTTNVKAYQIVEIVEGTQSYARAEEVSVVPANQAVLVRSDNGAGTYQIPVTRTSATLESNLLKASTEPITATAANTIYCLANYDGNTGFYPVAVGTTLPQGKGYLDMSSSNAKPARIFLDGNNATGIAIPTTEAGEQASAPAAEVKAMENELEIRPVVNKIDLPAADPDRAVREVEDDWAQWFGKGDRVFCAFDGDKVASFCLLDSFGEADGKKVGAPGCVGTVPAYRKQGIGLRMVQKATAILREQGYDLSWIHYTAVGHWYAKLGYKTVVRWNCKGIVE